MENNLYYTPEISEFHVGFECEILGIIGAKEDERLFSQSTIISQKELELIHLLEIRVKTLDKSDIESLGWEFEKKHAGLEEICFSTGGPDYHDILYMNYDLDSKYMRISWLGEGDVTRFSGTIKNKSELIKLMQQLNIK